MAKITLESLNELMHASIQAATDALTSKNELSIPLAAFHLRRFFCAAWRYYTEKNDSDRKNIISRCRAGFRHHFSDITSSDIETVVQSFSAKDKSEFEGTLDDNTVNLKTHRLYLRNEKRSQAVLISIDTLKEILWILKTINKEAPPNKIVLLERFTQIGNHAGEIFRLLKKHLSVSEEHAGLLKELATETPYFEEFLKFCINMSNRVSHDHVLGEKTNEASSSSYNPFSFLAIKQTTWDSAIKKYGPLLGTYIKNLERLLENLGPQKFQTYRQFSESQAKRHSVYNGPLCAPPSAFIFTSPGASTSAPTATLTHMR